MRTLFLVGALAAGLAAQDAAPVFVEVVPGATTLWLHQPCTLVVRIGADATFFAAQGVPLFQQRLDQPFHVIVPWLQGAEDRAVEFVPPSPGTPGQRLAVGDSVAVAVPAGQRQQGGRTFDVLELRYRWLPLAEGTSPIAPVEVRYAFASKFVEDFLRGRQPQDQKEQSVLSTPLQLQVKALPLAGRPASWAGAVGEFTVAAKAMASTVAVGDSFPLEVEVTGEGNLERFPPMPSPSLPGFHVQGMVERRTTTARTFVFDVLALREDATLVPAVRFAAFSPSRSDYVTHEAGPVPIVVTKATTALPPRVQDLVLADARARRESWPWSLWFAAGFGCATIALGLRRRHRTQKRRAARVHDLRVAADAMAAATTPEAALQAHEHLVAVCVCDEVFAGEAAWSRLARIGVPALVVASAQALHAQLDGARYGGAPVPPAEIRKIAEALFAHCATAGG